MVARLLRGCIDISWLEGNAVMTPLIFCYYQHQLRSALLQVVSLKVILWPDQVSSRHVAVFTDEIRLRFSLHVCGKAGKATPASSVAAR